MSPFFAPIRTTRSFNDDLQSLHDVLVAGKLSGTADIVNSYELKLAERFGSKYCLALSSGSTAIHVALHVAGVDRSKEVIVPATAPVPSVLPILCLGATPVFTDTAEGSFGLDVADVERKLTARTAAVLTVPLYGYPQDYDALLKLLVPRGIPLVEDAAQAHGATLSSRTVGSLGLIGCFSTHDNKFISTGEGGFLVTNSESHYEAAKSFARLGGLDGINEGYNFKLAALAAGLGQNRLKYLDEILVARRERAAYIKRALSHLDLAEISIPDDGCPNYYALVFRVEPNKYDGRKIREFLHSEGVESDFIRYGYTCAYYRPIFSQFFRDHCVNAENFLQSLITLPTHPGISNAIVARLQEKLSAALLMEGRHFNLLGSDCDRSLSSRIARS